jgi:hypothetical protein
MREELLYALWNAQSLQTKVLKSHQNLDLIIYDYGESNALQGPDISGARITLGGVDLYGNVELHIQSSDWIKHGHYNDPRYENVILHVVWKFDNEVYTSSNRCLDTLVLSEYFTLKDLHNLQVRFNEKNKFPCAKYLHNIQESLKICQLQESLHMEWQKQVQEIYAEASNLHFDWDRVFFNRLLSYAVDPQNRMNMSILATCIPLSVIRRFNLKEYLSWIIIESGIWDSSPNATQSRYDTIVHKTYSPIFPKMNVSLLWQHRNLRPSSFPLIRIIQVFHWIHSKRGYFDAILNEIPFDQAIRELDIPNENGSITIPNWNRTMKWKIFQNVLVPIWSARKVYLGEVPQSSILEMFTHGNFESNRITQEMHQLMKCTVQNQRYSYSLMAQYKNFCVEKQCTQCLIGNQLWFESSELTVD